MTVRVQASLIRSDPPADYPGRVNRRPKPVELSSEYCDQFPEHPRGSFRREKSRGPVVLRPGSSSMSLNQSGSFNAASFGFIEPENSRCSSPMQIAQEAVERAATAQGNERPRSRSSIPYSVGERFGDQYSPWASVSHVDHAERPLSTSTRPSSSAAKHEEEWHQLNRSRMFLKGLRSYLDNDPDSFLTEATPKSNNFMTGYAGFIPLASKRNWVPSKIFKAQLRENFPHNMPGYSGYCPMAAQNNPTAKLPNKLSHSHDVHCRFPKATYSRVSSRLALHVGAAARMAQDGGKPSD